MKSNIISELDIDKEDLEIWIREETEKVIMRELFNDDFIEWFRKDLMEFISSKIVREIVYFEKPQKTTPFM